MNDRKRGSEAKTGDRSTLIERTATDRNPIWTRSWMKIDDHDRHHESHRSSAKINQLRWDHGSGEALTRDRSRVWVTQLDDVYGFCGDDGG
ncbi:hypothetical protein Dsin_023543 [Dipteronia sinensis]|uniref:Uncharacterized protein n=1 Tax=Dipteronia sinensis TaxID=43782 RepID=A0AAE0A3H3_9ROSI|nr:hypothetical protein Dsin_023543 [Dipteronia sinensis]